MAYDFNPLKKNLTGIEEWFKKELQQIRTGQASPAILDGVKVNVYGQPMALREVASILIEGARSIRITPWDKAQVKEIEKAISISNLGVSSVVDGEGVRVNFPELTGETRLSVVKVAKEKLEESKKKVRAFRDDIVKDLQAKEKAGGYGKDEIFRLKNEAQKLIDEVIKKLDGLFDKKEKEITS